MKIRVKSIHPNPYRDMANYTISPEKVEALKESIEYTGFWDNIICRDHPENGHSPGYQLAYGHHRLAALKELGIDEIDIPVKDLDDATMLRIMANENMEEWSMTASVVNETVKAVRDFLNKEISKEVPDPALMDSLALNGRGSLEQARNQGVGQTTILKFLGSHWKQWRIQAALQQLDAIDAGDIDKEALESLKTTEVANAFTKAVKTVGLSKKLQREVAKKINEEGIGKRDVFAVVDEARKIKKLPKPKKVTEHTQTLNQGLTEFYNLILSQEDKIVQFKNLVGTGAEVDLMIATKIVYALKRVKKEIGKLFNTLNIE